MLTKGVQRCRSCGISLIFARYFNSNRLLVRYQLASSLPAFLCSSGTIMDPQSLIQQLSEKFEVSYETSEHLFANSSIPIDTPPISSAVVGLASVSTFVAQKSFCNFVVPQFASHWGIICEYDPEVKYLYHLLFDPRKKQVTFGAMIWNDDWDKHCVIHVGQTSYDHIKVAKIGTRLY